MAGTIINVALILLGGWLGINPRRQLAPHRQAFVKRLLGAFAVLLGFRLIWLGLGNGSGFWGCLKQLGIGMLAMILGRLAGKLLRLQQCSNRLGEYARKRMELAGKQGGASFSDGFVTCALLYCASPLAVLGALQDGLQGQWQLLAVKGVMDGLGAMAFVQIFGRGVLLSGVPVLAWQGFLGLGAMALAQSGPMQNPHILGALLVANGLLTLSSSLIFLDAKKVELTDYLPTLAIAPLLAAWWL